VDGRLALSEINDFAGARQVTSKDVTGRVRWWEPYPKWSKDHVFL